jgi:hypothetical protein
MTRILQRIELQRVANRSERRIVDPIYERRVAAAAQAHHSRHSVVNALLCHHVVRIVRFHATLCSGGLHWLPACISTNVELAT